MSSSLADKSLLIIFSYSPVGLGHLRVTDALYHGLPKGTTEPILLNSQDKSLAFFHRIMSVNPYLRRFAEWAQKGIVEDVTTALYRMYIRSHTQSLYSQLLTLINERYEKPSKVLVVASHYGLAHQLAEIRTRLENETKIKMILVLQVTDDSPQHVWYVPGVDLIFVPSETTKEKLEQYGKSMNLTPIKFIVNAYPLNPELNKQLTDKEMNQRVYQVDNSKSIQTQVIIPISGAAVGTDFFIALTDEMHKKSNRFIFNIVCKIAPFTEDFIKDMAERSYVRLSLGSHDRDVIDAYQRIYQKEIISLEITKPSEQAFKALADCSRRSSSILLFTEPVGKQEYDNLEFLRRHKLIPENKEVFDLWEAAKNDRSTVGQDESLLQKAKLWRGIQLPKQPEIAANFIWWCLKNGIFTAMMSCKIKPDEADLHKLELSSDGVKTFWKTVETIL